jgi:AhpD family alkylhydroperoxidase
MTIQRPVEYAKASPAVRAVFDNIKKTRRVADVNNFWKYLANDPKTLKRTWESLRDVMGPGEISPLVKEMIYLAVSISNGCRYCIASHGTMARAKGMSEQMFGELVAIVGMANEANRLVEAYRVPVDAAFNQPSPRPGGIRATVRPKNVIRAQVRRGPSKANGANRIVAQIRR